MLLSGAGVAPARREDRATAWAGGSPGLLCSPEASATGGEGTVAVPRQTHPLPVGTPKALTMFLFSRYLKCEPGPPPCLSAQGLHTWCHPRRWTLLGAVREWRPSGSSASRNRVFRPQSAPEMRERDLVRPRGRAHTDGTFVTYIYNARQGAQSLVCEAIHFCSTVCSQKASENKLNAQQNGMGYQSQHRCAMEQ